MPLEHMRRMFREMETGKNRLSKKEWFELSNLMHSSTDTLSPLQDCEGSGKGVQDGEGEASAFQERRHEGGGKRVP